MTAIERKQRIIEVLCERREMKMDILADMFQVSLRTICRDIQELSLTYPIYTQTGTYGGVYVENGYYLGKQYLSEEQEQALEYAKQVLPEDVARLLESIQRKFSRPKR